MTSPAKAHGPAVGRRCPWKAVDMFVMAVFPGFLSMASFEKDPMPPGRRHIVW